MVILDAGHREPAPPPAEPPAARRQARKSRAHALTGGVLSCQETRNRPFLIHRLGLSGVEELPLVLGDRGEESQRVDQVGDHGHLKEPVGDGEK